MGETKLTFKRYEKKYLLSAEAYAHVLACMAEHIEPVGYLRSAIVDGNWHDSCIRILCQRLRVGAEERARYFGE